MSNAASTFAKLVALAWRLRARRARKLSRARKRASNRAGRRPVPSARLTTSPATAPPSWHPRAAHWRQAARPSGRAAFRGRDEKTSNFLRPEA
jgi:hypothetical protein